MGQPPPNPDPTTNATRDVQSDSNNTTPIANHPVHHSFTQSIQTDQQNARQDSLLGDATGYFDTGSSLMPTDVSSGALPLLHVRHPSTQIDSIPVAPQWSGTPATSTSVVSGHRFDKNSPPIPMPHPPLRSQLSTMSFNSQHSLSPASVVSSPSLAAMTDLTPLPSPLLPEDSPGPWKRGHARPGSAGSLRSLGENVQVEDFHSSSSATPSTSRAASMKKRKAYSHLVSAAVEGGSASRKPDVGHARSRSLSEYVPEPIHNVRPRNTTVSGIAKLDDPAIENQLHREAYLAEQRGYHISQPLIGVPPANSLPTPPPSNRSVTESEGDDVVRDEEHFAETFTIRDQRSGIKTQYRPIRPLGQGTFSKVVLATSQSLPGNFSLNEHAESSLDPKQLVAIKIVAHGPAGGADEERVELSLKREVEIMNSVSHPSLIHLKSFDFNEDEALLVLGYCAGGDLFDLASEHQDVLTSSMVHRIFAELADAVRYLHKQWIVHRDIKLESRPDVFCCVTHN
jgi:protein-serine/threonine kinase